jgi:sirohydrochlorin cobaltochelatase
MTDSPASTGILFAAAGTSCPEALQVFHRISGKAAERFPGIPHRWAFTSAGVRRNLKSQGISVSDPEEALMAMQKEGLTRVAIPSLHLSDGMEYSELVATASAMEGRGGTLNKVLVGKTLLTTENAFRRCLEILQDGLPSKLGSQDAIVFVAHGSLEPRAVQTLAAAVSTCRQMDRRLFMGMTLGEPSCEAVVKECLRNTVKKVWLVPLMVAAGYSVRDDMAGPGESSWKTAFGKAGIPCIPVLKGLAEYGDMVDIWMDQAASLLTELAG